MTGKKFISHYFQESRELESSYIEHNAKLSSFSLKIRGWWPKCDQISINDSSNIIMKVIYKTYLLKISPVVEADIFKPMFIEYAILLQLVFSSMHVCVFVCVLCIHIFLFNHLDNFIIISMWQIRKRSHSTITQSHAWFTPSFTWRVYYEKYGHFKIQANVNQSHEGLI